MNQVVVYDPDRHAHLVQAVVDIHIACTLENPTTIANFAPPYTSEKKQLMHEYWTERFVQAGPGGTDDIILSFSKDGNGVDQLSGYVILHKPVTESGPFRGNVQKLFVSPEFRRQGIARELMTKLEEVAWQHGRTMLALATAKPSPARSMYPKFGYIEYGGIPEYVLNPATGERMDELAFYKDLRVARRDGG